MAVIINREDEFELCTCPNCKSTIGYTDQDELYMGTDGKGLDCPKCGEFITVKKIPQTKWPDAFYSFNAYDGAIHVGNETVQRFIDECVSDLFEKNLDFTYTGTGDTMVFANWEDDSVVVRVCQGYYEGNVDRDWWTRHATV